MMSIEIDGSIKQQYDYFAISASLANDFIGFFIIIDNTFINHN